MPRGLCSVWGFLVVVSWRRDAWGARYARTGQPVVAGKRRGERRWWESVGGVLYGLRFWCRELGLCSSAVVARCQLQLNRAVPRESD